MTSCKLALSVLIFIATSLFPTPVFSAIEWEWQGGTSATSSSTYPGARHGAQTWVDFNGTLWMFSGVGKEATSVEGYLNSLFTYNPITNKWTSISGSFSTNVAGTFPSSSNSKGSPGGRYGASQWTDSAGNLWLFGGTGIGNDSSVQGLLNDLWKFSPSTGTWTFIGGSHAASAVWNTVTFPTPRTGAASWVDANGYLWLFGGNGQTFGSSSTTYLTDLWYFNPNTSAWSVGATDSNPNARASSACWTDSDGNGWLYGGVDASGNLLSDLWQYKTSDSAWYLKSGTPNVNQNPTYPVLLGGTGQPGGLQSASSWEFGGSFFLFGGLGLDKTGKQTVNRDLWVFNTTSLSWNYLYGTPGAVTGSTTDPGARSSAAAWVTFTGDVVVFGGSGYDTLGAATTGTLGDTWYIKACNFAGTCPSSGDAQAAVPTSTSSTGTTTSGTTVAAGLTSGGTTTGIVPTANATTTSSLTSGTTGTTGTTGTSTTSTPAPTVTPTPAPVVTTSATVTVTMGMTGDPTAVNTSSVGGNVAASLNVSADQVNVTIVLGSRKRADVAFSLVISVTYPNSSAIAAATGSAPAANMTSALTTLQAVVTSAANGTAVRQTLQAAGVTVTSVTASTESTVVTVSTTTGYWPFTTASHRSAASSLPSPSLLLSSLIVLVCSLLVMS